MRALFSLLFLAALCAADLSAQSTRLLREPDLSADHIVFTYGADVWIADRAGGEARRLTSTPAIESTPHFSPDGTTVAFTSNRKGVAAVYTVAASGGEPTRLTWYPAGAQVRGWSPDGSRILYATNRETAPSPYDRLWSVPASGGPSELVTPHWGHDGDYSPDGSRLVVDRVSRWDVEWRNYRGGQNQPLTLFDPESLEEVYLPNEATTDRHPVWAGEHVYFISDRDLAANVWAFSVANGDLRQITQFVDAEAKWLNAHNEMLVVEQDGYVHLLDPSTGALDRVDIQVSGDFPWAEAEWVDVSSRARAASLSPSGKRALFEARGEIFTVPAEHGDVRNLTRSSGAADRAPIWSPDGQHVAWFSDEAGHYTLMIADQSGMDEPRSLSIGESKLGWEPAWSPDGAHIAFVDDDVRVRVIDVESGAIQTVDVAGDNNERGNMALTWSPDSKWLAYEKTFPNRLHRIVVWSSETGEVHALTNGMADARLPAWDRGGEHLYFMASTDLAQDAGWANTSNIKPAPTYGVYALLLHSDGATPFSLRSDEEPVKETEEEEGEEVEDAGVRIDLEGLDERVIALPMPQRPYGIVKAGPEGTVFVGERVPNTPGYTLHKFSLEDREASEFISGVSQVSISADASKMLVRAGSSWRIVGTGSKPSGSDGRIDVVLRVQLDRMEEWTQIFEETWRYERDYFYDPEMHGNDWNAVYDRYAPLVPHVRHRHDLTYLLDQINGELSVGHSFVGGGDYPEIDSEGVGLLGATLELQGGGWMIGRILTYESWNPNLTAPLDRAGLDVSEGDYIVAIGGRELTATIDPYRLLDGTVGQQTSLMLNDRPSMEGARSVVVEPIGSEFALRQRAWVEDNRRMVDELSGGRLAYVWVPNTGRPGVVSFDRYFFAQQDKEGAVIDERYNGGGLLDDYMVDLMTRRLRAAVTNEAPGGRHFRLPSGVLGPKALLINERAGSGGDFFPWVFRQQEAGPLIGKTTWGGLVKSSTHYLLVDGGRVTAPDNAVFDPIAGEWIAENFGVAPDIEVEFDQRSAAEGRDPQIERAVEVVLQMIAQEGPPPMNVPAYSTPGGRPQN